MRTTITAEDELVARAVDFMSEIRCFLHYSNGRNDNTLTYEMQAAAAARALGIADGPAKVKPRSWRWRPNAPAEHEAAEWMRMYFRHARTLNRRLLRYMEQKSAADGFVIAGADFQRRTRAKRSRASAKPFAVRDGLMEVVAPGALSDRAIMFSLFTAAAAPACR